MASPVGLAIRNERALTRLNVALAALAETLGVEVPDGPGRSRDAFLGETLRLEWMADSLELLASPPESDDGQEPEGENDQVPEDANGEAADEPNAEGDGAPSEDPGSEPTGEDVATVDKLPDREDLKELKLADLKQMAVDRGVEGVEDARAKDVVIDALLGVEVAD